MRILGAIAVTSALILASIPAAAAEDCKPLKLVDSIKLTSSPDGYRKYVPVKIAGTPKLLILDLGAEWSVLSGKVAEELKLSTYTGDIVLYDITGASTDKMTKVQTTLGRMNGQLKFMVGRALADTDNNPKVAGLLGTDVLSNFDVSIDFATDTLDLIDKKHCEGKVLYWPAPVLAVVPFQSWHSGKIVFDVTLDGKKLKAILDTGAPNSSLNMTTAQLDFDITPGAPDTPEIGHLNQRDDLKTYFHVFKTLDFNGVAVLNPRFVLIPDALSKKLAPGAQTGSHITAKDDAVESPILLGMNVLKRLHIYIAYDEKKIYITPASIPGTASAAQ